MFIFVSTFLPITLIFSTFKLEIVKTFITEGMEMKKFLFAFSIALLTVNAGYAMRVKSNPVFFSKRSGKKDENPPYFPCLTEKEKEDANIKLAFFMFHNNIKTPMANACVLKDQQNNATQENDKTKGMAHQTWIQLDFLLEDNKETIEKAHQTIEN